MNNESIIRLVVRVIEPKSIIAKCFDDMYTYVCSNCIRSVVDRRYEKVKALDKKKGSDTPIRQIASNCILAFLYQLFSLCRYLFEKILKRRTRGKFKWKRV